MHAGGGVDVPVDVPVAALAGVRGPTDRADPLTFYPYLLYPFRGKKHKQYRNGEKP